MSIGFSFDMPPFKAVEYLKDKGHQLTFDYDEMMHEAHHKAFTVAKVTKLDLLSDIHQSLISAQQEGKGFEQWQKELIPTLKKHGWLGDVTVTNPTTGEIKDIHVGSRRLKTIYDTNMRVSHAQARYSSQMNSNAQYLRYWALLDKRTRPTHSSKHGVILPKNDPWWGINYPPNGWKCRCKAQALTIEEIEAKGLKISKQKHENIADPDWAYNVGDTGKFGVEKSYWEKIKAFICKSENAKQRTVLCDFAQTVKKQYKEDMKKLLPQKEEWVKFVKDSLDTDIKRHQKMRVGYLSMIAGLESWLSSNPPQSDCIVATTGDIRNLRAKGADVSKALKPKPVISIEDIENLIEDIHNPSEIYDDGMLIFIYNTNDKQNKIVIFVDGGDKKEIYNSIYSGQLYTIKALKNIVENLIKIK